MNWISIHDKTYRQWLAVLLLIWYTLLSSHAVFILPVYAGVEEQSRRAPLSQEVDHRTPRSTPVPALPDHESHSETEAALCVMCDVSAMTVESVPDIPLQHLLAPVFVEESPALSRNGHGRDQAIPDEPVPDPPLKIPISLESANLT